MGFKIQKGKSWKNASTKHAKKSIKADTYKPIVEKKSYEDLEVSDKQRKKNDKASADFFEGFGKKKNYEKTGEIFEDGGNATKKTWNAASAGVGRSLGGLSEGMSNLVLAGAVALGFFVLIPLILPDKRNKPETQY